MKSRKVFSLLLAGLLTVSLGTTAFAAEDEIAAVQAQKQDAEAGLAQAQANISSLEGKKQELENYLAELNAQYDELTNSVAQLSIEAAEKEEELTQVKIDLQKARKAAEEQYEAMKIRIAYMYEKGGSTTLELLLSAKDVSEFLNRAENVAQISEYDRNMLTKYENLRASIREQEEQVEQEAEEINNLMAERSAKQQEVQAMAASTNDSIVSYVNEISASESEASALMAEINSADNNIAQLVQQAEEEQAAQEAAAAAEEAEAAAAEESAGDEDYGYDPDEDTMDSSSSSTSSDIIVEEEDDSDYSQNGSSDYEEDTSGEEDYTEDSYEDTSYEGTSYEDTSSEDTSSSDSGQGTYLGNFTLTAYCNCAQCCGTAGNLTASGTVPTAGRTVAMAGVPFGTQLLINGNVYTVEDLGTPYGHVDIYFDSHSDALSFGLQYADVYQLN